VRACKRARPLYLEPNMRILESLLKQVLCFGLHRFREKLRFFVFREYWDESSNWF